MADDFWDLFRVPNYARETNAKVAPARAQYTGANNRLDPNAISAETLAGYGVPSRVTEDASPYLSTFKLSNDISKSALTPPEESWNQTLGRWMQVPAMGLMMHEGNRGAATALLGDNLNTQSLDRQNKYQDAQRESVLKNAQNLTGNVDQIIAQQQKARAAARAEKDAMANRENIADRFSLQGDQRTGYVLNDKFEPAGAGGTDDIKEYNTAVQQGFKGTIIDYFAAKRGEGENKPPAGYRFAADGKSLEPIPGGPAAGSKRDLKEYQTKDAMFAERMNRAEKVLESVAAIDEKGQPKAGAYNPAQNSNAWWPDDGYGGIANLTNSKEWQQYQQAAREGIAAILRKDTGAAVTETEWNLYFPMYYPQPGDSPEVVAQKKASRDAAAQALRGSSGPAYEVMFGADGQKNRTSVATDLPDPLGIR
jgi:hypothetical protein